MHRPESLDSFIMLVAYVDNLLYTRDNVELLDHFESDIKQNLKVTVNHNVTQFLGLNVTQWADTIHLSAAKCAETLARKFSIAPIGLTTPFRVPPPNHEPDTTPQSAADHLDRRSCTGFVFDLEPVRTISSNSQKQELITFSSAEAEFIAASASVREGLYLTELLQETKMVINGSFKLLCNKQTTIKIANKPGFVNRTKHIALRYFFVKDEIDKGKVQLTAQLAKWQPTS
ncbi:unnamed protein product [Closterium sp. NIES-53]